MKARSEENPDGKETEITLSADMKISDLTKALKDAGLSANFDATNQRFYISAAKSGADYDFDITANDEAGVNALKNMGIYTLSDEQKKMYQDIASWDAAAMKNAHKDKLTLAGNLYSYVSQVTGEYEEQYGDYQKLLDYQKKIEELQGKIDGGDSDTSVQDQLNQYKTEYDALAAKYSLDAYDTADLNDQKSKIEAKQKEIADKYSSVTNNNGVITLQGMKEAALQEECKKLKDASDPRAEVLASVLGALDADGNIKTDSEGNIEFGSLDKEAMQYADEIRAAKNAYQEKLETSEVNYNVYDKMKKLLEDADAAGNPLTGDQLTEYNEFAKGVGMDAYDASSAADALTKINTEMAAIANEFTVTPGANGVTLSDNSLDRVGDIIQEKADEYNTNLDTCGCVRM